VPYDRVFALHTLRNMAYERKDAHIMRFPTSRLNRTVRFVRPDSPAPPDSPVAYIGQSGLSPASGTESFVLPDCPVRL
jgi:hypothetical protein